MKTHFTLLFCLLLVVPAAAATTPGWYASLFVGGTSISDTTLEASGTPLLPAADYDASFDPGWYFGFSGGYDFGAFRLEAELSDRLADFDSVRTAGGGTLPGGADGISVMTLLAGLYVDLENSSPLTPYAGVSGGMATLWLEGEDHPDDDWDDDWNDWDDNDDHGNTGALQFAVGIEAAINERVSLDLGYRFLKTGEASVGTGSWERRLEIEAQSVALGLRVKF